MSQIVDSSSVIVFNTDFSQFNMTKNAYDAANAFIADKYYPLKAVSSNQHKVLSISSVNGSSVSYKNCNHRFDLDMYGDKLLLTCSSCGFHKNISEIGLSFCKESNTVYLDPATESVPCDFSKSYMRLLAALFDFTGVCKALNINTCFQQDRSLGFSVKAVFDADLSNYIENNNLNIDLSKH